ncbi:hypothetical protein CDO73_09810 [Saccharibacillus sp. O23]|uniref:methyl-accepting chemotaxis protein n=1 Tax=Saccharibacillus sp. O23 TaxID=2009338 RepID=UPI000B4E73D6|nr:methyl-accepting chemotaxis protein [Saccharibacillus sp. O23]OWR30873.1 hypothetical protein CDO73_09810 [Saccharibacillus sp. O23]
MPTAFEKNSSKLIFYTLEALLLSLYPIFAVMWLTRLLTLSDMLTLFVVDLLLIGGYYALYKFAADKVWGKYALVVGSFVVGNVLFLFIPSSVIWVPFFIYLSLSLVYLSRPVVIAAGITAVLSLVLQFLANPFIPVYAPLDYAVIFIVFVMVAVTNYAVCMVGQNMLKESDRQKEKIEELLQEVERSAAELKTFGESVASGANETFRFSEEAASSFSEISKGIEIQAENIQEINEAMIRSGQNIERISGESVRLNEVSLSTKQLTEEGGRKAAELREEMKQVRGSMHDTVSQVQLLNRYAEEAQAILTAISQIANQTNLLSLNASIEAARAGEQGRGFAVVAGEIRGLSANVQTSAEDIAGLLRQIRGQTGTVSDYVSGSESTLESLERRTFETGELFDRINQDASDVLSKSAEVQQNVERLKAFNGSIAGQVSDFSAISEQTSASVELVAGSVYRQRDSIRLISDSVVQLETMIEDLQGLAARAEEAPAREDVRTKTT